MPPVTTSELPGPAGATVAERIATLQDGDGAELLELHDAADDAALARRLGAACRRSPQRLLVWLIDTGAGEPVPAERFFAFGFRRLFACREQDCSHTLYEYRLADYKQPPDWLNARYWANPERFDEDPDELKTLPDMDT